MPPKICLILVIFFCSLAEVRAQYDNPFGNTMGTEARRSPLRTILNQFSIGLTTGYGRTFYKHSPEGFVLIQKKGGLNIIDTASFNANGTNSGYSNWLNDAQISNELLVSPGDTIVLSDTASLGFRGNGGNVPLVFTLHYNIGRFRIGGGVSAEFASIPDLNPTYKPSPVFIDYKPDVKTSIQTRFFGTLGVRIYDYWDYSFAVDLQAGKLNRGAKFNQDQIESNTYLNLGLSIEKNLSEYFRLIIRPSYDIKKYDLNLPETDLFITHQQSAFYLNLGVSLNYPEIPRCKIGSCRTQLKHIHFGKEYRGQPIHRKQNPKYGENHPKLLRYKGRGKGKVNTF